MSSSSEEGLDELLDVKLSANQGSLKKGASLTSKIQGNFEGSFVPRWNFK